MAWTLKKLRMLKDARYEGESKFVGDVLDVEVSVAVDWIRLGLAEEVQANPDLPVVEQKSEVIVEDLKAPHRKLKKVVDEEEVMP